MVGTVRSLAISALLLAACAAPATQVVQPPPPGSEDCGRDQPARIARRNHSTQFHVESPYPPDAFGKGIQGWVCVEYALGADGAVTEAKVLASAPKGVFEKAALAEVLRWEFELPAGDPWAFGGQQVLVEFEIGPSSTRSESGQ